MKIRQETIDFLTLKITPAEYCKILQNDSAVLDELYRLLPEGRDIHTEEWRKINMAPELEYCKFDILHFLTRLEGVTTAYGKYKAYNLVYSIVARYADIPESTYYSDANRFLDDALPSYIGGEEVEPLLDRMYSELPTDISKTQKTKLFKEELKKHFLRKTNKYPYWPQSPNWPATKSGEPMVYVSQKRDGDLYMLLFEDPETGETRTVEEYM